MLQPPTDGGELRRNHKHIRMRPVDNNPTACEQPNTIDKRSAPVDKRPAVSSQLQQPTPAPDLSLRTASPGQPSPQSTVIAQVEQCAHPSKILEVAVLLPNHQVLISTVLSECVCVCVVKVKVCECDHSDGYFHFILVIVHMQKHELMIIS